MKLDLSRLEGIHDDMDFCSKLAKEELVIVLPGDLLSVGLLFIASRSSINCSGAPCSSCIREFLVE